MMRLPLTSAVKSYVSLSRVNWKVGSDVLKMPKVNQFQRDFGTGARDITERLFVLKCDSCVFNVDQSDCLSFIFICILTTEMQSLTFPHPVGASYVASPASLGNASALPPEKILIRLAEIFGVKVPPVGPANTGQRIIELFKLHGVYNDYLEMLVFIEKANRSDLNPFLFKIQRAVTQYIAKQPSYVNIDTTTLETETKALRSRLQYNNMKYYACDANDGKSYLSMDIRSANFTMLRRLLRGSVVADNWPDFLRSLVPNDTRGSGEVTMIPACIYQSKFLRQFFLGPSNKLKYVWELENVQQLEKICQLNISNRIHVQSDEIVIEVSNYEEADALLQRIPVPPIYRVRKLTLQSLPGYRKNTMLRLFSDGTKSLINAHPEEYEELYRRYITSP